MSAALAGLAGCSLCMPSSRVRVGICGACAYRFATTGRRNVNTCCHLTAPP